MNKRFEVIEICPPGLFSTSVNTPRTNNFQIQELSKKIDRPPESFEKLNDAKEHIKKIKKNSEQYAILECNDLPSIEKKLIYIEYP